jgi:hypothetical protein
MRLDGLMRMDLSGWLIKLVTWRLRTPRLHSLRRGVLAHFGSSLQCGDESAARGEPDVRPPPPNGDNGDWPRWSGAEDHQRVSGDAQDKLLVYWIVITVPLSSRPEDLASD